MDLISWAFREIHHIRSPINLCPLSVIKMKPPCNRHRNWTGKLWSSGFWVGDRKRCSFSDLFTVMDWWSPITPFYAIYSCSVYDRWMAERVKCVLFSDRFINGGNSFVVPYPFCSGRLSGTGDHIHHSRPSSKSAFSSSPVPVVIVRSTSLKRDATSLLINWLNVNDDATTTSESIFDALRWIRERLFTSLLLFVSIQQTK